MSVQSEIDRINGAKSTLAANIESAGFAAGEGASIVQLASTVGDAFTDTSSRLSTVNGSSGTISTQLDALDSTKAAIKDAIVAKGVEVPEGTTFYEYAGLIDGIETGGSKTIVKLTRKNAGVYADGNIFYMDENGSYTTKSLDDFTNGTSIDVVAESPVVCGMWGMAAIASFDGNCESVTLITKSITSAGDFSGGTTVVAYNISGDITLFV